MSALICEKNRVCFTRLLTFHCTKPTRPSRCRLEMALEYVQPCCMYSTEPNKT